MDLVVIYLLGYLGLALVIPTSYTIFKRRYPQIGPRKAILASVLIYLLLVIGSMTFIDRMSTQHFFVVLAAITAFTWILFLHHIEILGTLYNQLVQSFYRGSTTKHLGLVKRNLYYLLFVLMLLRGNFYCGATQFYRVFGISLKPYEIDVDLTDRIKIADTGVLFHRNYDTEQVQIPQLRWVTAYNFTEKHVVVPREARFDRDTGLQIILNIIRATRFHWLKLIFKP